MTTTEFKAELSFPNKKTAPLHTLDNRNNTINELWRFVKRELPLMPAVTLKAQVVFSKPEYLLSNDTSQTCDFDPLELDREVTNIIKENVVVTYSAYKIRLLITHLMGSLEIENKDEFFHQLEGAIARIIVLQELATTFPKEYHNIVHSLETLDKFIRFLKKSPLIHEYLKVNGVLNDLLLTIILHDSVLFANFGDLDSQKQGFGVIKDVNNEYNSVAHLAERYKTINLGTQINKGTDKLIELQTLENLLKDDNISLEQKFAASLLAFFDTFSEDYETFLANGIKVWMEEYGLKSVFNLVENHLKNDSIVSISSYKLGLNIKLKRVRTLKDFIQVIRKYNVSFFGEDKESFSIIEEQVDKILLGSIKLFLTFQGPFAHNLKLNCEGILYKLRELGLEYELLNEFSEITNYRKVFSELTISANLASLIVSHSLECNDLDKLIDYIPDGDMARDVTCVFSHWEPYYNSEDNVLFGLYTVDNKLGPQLVTAVVGINNSDDLNMGLAKAQLLERITKTITPIYQDVSALMQP